MASRPETGVSKAYRQYIRFAQFHRFSIAFVSVYRSRGPIISIPVKRRALSSRIYGVSTCFTFSFVRIPRSPFASMSDRDPANESRRPECMCLPAVVIIYYIRARFTRIRDF